MLAIPLERLAFIIAKAREFDAEVPVEPDAATGSDGPDDDEREVLLDTPDNPTEQELRDAIDGLGVPERQELLALMWLGRDARYQLEVEARHGRRVGWPAGRRASCRPPGEVRRRSSQPRGSPARDRQSGARLVGRAGVPSRLESLR